jgi:hypothetical protein
MNLKVCYILILPPHSFNRLSVVDVVVVAYTGMFCASYVETCVTLTLCLRSSTKHLKHLLLDPVFFGYQIYNLIIIQFTDTFL